MTRSSEIDVVSDEICEVRRMVKRLYFWVAMGIAAAVVNTGTLLFAPALAVALIAVVANAVLDQHLPELRRAPKWAVITAGYCAIASVVLIVGGAGIHLFNAINDSGPIALGTSDGSSDSSNREAMKVDWSDAEDVMDEHAIICGPVASVNFSEGDTFINVGKDYPDPNRFTVVVWNEIYDDFSEGDTMCASGRVGEYDGVPQIRTYDPNEDLSRD